MMQEPDANEEGGPQDLTFRRPKRWAAGEGLCGRAAVCSGYAMEEDVKPGRRRIPSYWSWEGHHQVNLLIYSSETIHQNQKKSL